MQQMKHLWNDIYTPRTIYVLFRVCGSLHVANDTNDGMRRTTKDKLSQEFSMFGFVIQIRSFPTMKLFHTF